MPLRRNFLRPQKHGGEKYYISTIDRKRWIKKRNRKVPVPLGNAVFILLEVTLQHALQSNAVAGLVTSHLVDDVVGNLSITLLLDY